MRVVDLIAVLMDWQAIGSTILHKKTRLSFDQFQYHFKLRVCLVEYVWKKMISRYHCEPKHFLWTLHFLKSRDPNEQGIASLLHTDKKTLLLHVEETLQKLLIILPEV